MLKRILLIALILAITTSSYAEDEAKNQIYAIKSFEKGLNQKTSPYSLPENQCDIAENIRFGDELGSISKRTNLNVYGTADATNPILGSHRFYMKDGTKVLLVNAGNKILKGNDSTGAFTNILTVSSGNHRWQWLTWHDIAIGCDGYNQPVKYDGTSASATYLGSCLATDAGTGAGPDGTYTYKISFYTTSYEVLLNVASNTITVTDNDINLSMIPIGPDTYGGEAVIGRKVYRTSTGGTDYKLLTNGTIANNTAVTLVDSDADAARGAAYPTGDATYAPPKGRFSIIHQDRLWFANDPTNNPSRAWYSESESHDIFVDDSYWDVRQNDGDSIEFIKQVLGILTIGKDNSISKIYTTGTADEWELSDPVSFIGCQAPYSASNYGSGLIYLARSGIYTFNGQYSQLISDVVTPEINRITSSDFENCWGIYHNNIYYLAYSSSETSVSYNNRVLLYDVVDDAYSIDLLNINCFTSFDSGDDWGILYAGGSDVGKVYSYSAEDNQIIHKIHSDFTGLWDDMRYIPENAGGSSNSPILEIAWTETINEMSGKINSQTGIINRPDTNGHYVSQPLRVNASVFDKLYWNEVIPVSGGDVTLKLRTSSAGEKNLILNDCFELWDNNPTVKPNDWTAASTSTSVVACASSTAIKYRGTYSARVNTEATISQILLNSSNYAGKAMIFDAWVNSANTVADKVYIEISDGYTSDRAYYTNTGAWQETEATITCNATANTVTLICAVLNGSDAPAYFDQVMSIEGSDCYNDWSAWSSAYSNPAGSDISAETVNNYLQYMVNMTTDNISYTPTIERENNYNIKINYDKEGTVQSTNIPIEWRSGWLDMGYPQHNKTLRKMYIYHEGTAGTLSVNVENLEGDTDTFNIDLATYPTQYSEYFTNGAMLGRYFRVTLTNNDVNPLKIKRIVLIYDVEPMY